MRMGFEPTHTKHNGLKHLKNLERSSKKAGQGRDETEEGEVCLHASFSGLPGAYYQCGRFESIDCNHLPLFMYTGVEIISLHNDRWFGFIVILYKLHKLLE